MELKIVNPDSNDFCEAVGISPERQKKLSKALDEMVHRLDNQPVHLVKMHDIFAEILSFCNNNAESTYCTILHCGWHARRGRVLAPGPLNPERIKLAIGDLWDRLRKDQTRDSQEIMKKLTSTNRDEIIKQGAREGVERLLELKEIDLAKDIMNKLTGFAF